MELVDYYFVENGAAELFCTYHYWQSSSNSNNNEGIPTSSYVVVFEFCDFSRVTYTSSRAGAAQRHTPAACKLQLYGFLPPNCCPRYMFVRDSMPPGWLIYEPATRRF
jgi:hypothetical protein